MVLIRSNLVNLLYPFADLKNAFFVIGTYIDGWLMTSLMTFSILSAQITCDKLSVRNLKDWVYWSIYLL